MTKQINLPNTYLFTCDGIQNHDALDAIEKETVFYNKHFDIEIFRFLSRKHPTQ